MNLWLRVLWVMLSSLWRPRVTHPLQPARLRLRTWITDLDTNNHMNNGRFLTLMDLGRFDLVLRSGLLRFMLHHHSVPILAAAQIRYRLPLDPFEPFDLETRLLGWDDKWAYIEQRFIKVRGDQSGAVAAIALIKGGFYDKRKRAMVPTAPLILEMGHDPKSPVLPDYVRSWLVAEDALRGATAPS